jgi:Protein of unknown function (DUF3375)
MNVVRTSTSLRNLRERPLWKLLAADKAPATLALLKALLLDDEKVLPASVLHERLGREMALLRDNGEDLPRTAQATVSEWLAQGWVTRRFPAGASEEVYEPSVEAADAVRIIDGLIKPRIAATESRLTTVIEQLTRLAEETNTNPASRIDALIAERTRIEQEIEAVRGGKAKVLPVDRALERVREIITLADELTGDFRRVRDEFSKLNRQLRESLMENEGSRGDVLEALFAGVDVINESEAGKTFEAFWRLLTDRDQAATLAEALDDVTGRPFASLLESHERRFLINLTGLLVDEGGNVHDVLQHFARSLKSFVQSREYLEQRRLHALLKQAQTLALGLRDHVRPNLSLGYTLTLTTSRIHSASRWALYDPSQRIVDSTMPDAEPAEISLEAVNELVRQSEIDFRSLRNNIRRLLAQRSQASIGDLLEAFPAAQGLGSVIGYIALGVRHGEVTTDVQLVHWVGEDSITRHARVPAIYFLSERLDDLVN